MPDVAPESALPQTPAEARAWSRPLWLLAGALCLLLGAIGAFLPLLPTVPFVLLAAWCFSRGSPRWEAWLLAHPRLGPMVLNWRRHRMIPRRIKHLAWTMMGLSCALAWWRAPWWAALLASAICLGVVAWMAPLPEAPAEAR